MAGEHAMVGEEGEREQDFAMLSVDEAAMWELELRASGGLLACSSAMKLRAGDGICVVFHLSTGAAFRINAQVRCLQPLAGSNKLAAWIEYTQLGATERREFLRWQANITRDSGCDRVCVEVEHKYQVRRRGAALTVSISGLLEASEARALSETIRARVDAEDDDLRVLLLELNELALSSEESLRHTRRWLHLLRRARLRHGILVGKSSPGCIQLRRLLRETGLGEVMQQFDSMHNALPSWRLLVGQLPPSSPHSWSEEGLCA